MRERGGPIIQTLRPIVVRLLGWFLVGAVLVALASELPARQTATIGQNDGGYVQGFHDAANRWGVTTDDTGVTTPYRWTAAESFVVFPQVGWPAQATLRWRGWRPSGTTPPTVQVLLNGTTELGRFPATGDWETHTFAITTGLAKPDDLFLAIRVDPPFEYHDQQVGIQVDQAILATDGWPLIPAPGQVVQGGVALALAAALVRRRRWLVIAALVGIVTWLLLYRLALPGYPFRHLLRFTILGLAATLAIRHAPTVAALVSGRRAHLAAVAGIILWLVVLIGMARQHTVLSVPGVEKDFRVFATRSSSLSCPAGEVRSEAACVFRADGFYQLGYPFLLWAARPLVHDNPFLAARVVALGSAVVLLIAVYLLGLQLFGQRPALLGLAIAALSPFTIQYALLLGSDMPFAAAWTAALAAMAWTGRDSRPWRLVLAGALAAVAFIIRHPGIVLLPLAFAVVAGVRPAGWNRRLLKPFGWLLAGFVVVSLPQLAANTLHTDQPLYSQQAKNIWLAVYGNTDWAHWPEASNDVGLLDVIRHEPDRFWANWGHNLAAVAGSGAADQSEFGQALALRLLAFPANLLALAGLVRWLRGRGPGWWLALGSLLYIVAVAVGFLLLRFMLPLVGVWALAAASVTALLANPGPDRFRQTRQVALALALVATLATQMRTGSATVLDRQPPEDAALVAAITRLVPPGAAVASALAPDEPLDKYSAIAHRFATDAAYVVWSERSNLPRPAGQELAAAGPYHLIAKGSQ